MYQYHYIMSASSWWALFFAPGKKFCPVQNFSVIFWPREKKKFNNFHCTTNYSIFFHVFSVITNYHLFSGSDGFSRRFARQ